jgi:hypothetical protein
MWLSQQMISAQKRQPSAELTEVTSNAVMQGENEHRGVPICAPWGVAYMPPTTAQAVVVSTNAGAACVGTIEETPRIAPGELLLFSCGGASIYLKNSGEVIINGQVFAAKKEG